LLSNNKKIMKRIIKILALGACIYHTSCKSHAEETAEDVQYTVTSPLQTDTTLNKDYVAQIRSIKNIEVRAQSRGFLEKIYVDEGQQVKAGQLLFKIMPRVYEAELMKARAEADAAAIE